jgi:hypothetical protein
MPLAKYCATLTALYTVRGGHLFPESLPMAESNDFEFAATATEDILENLRPYFLRCKKNNASLEVSS